MTRQPVAPAATSAARCAAPPDTPGAGRAARPANRAPGRAQAAASASIPLGPVTPHLHAPTPHRPVRVKQHWLSTQHQIVPHAHPWGQLTTSATGVVRLTVADGTYIVPPSRALWVPPGVEHAVSVVEDADLRTLYLHQPEGRCGPDVSRAQEPAWRECRVLEMSDLLRALVLELDVRPDGAAPPPDAEALQRERRIGTLVLDEMRRALPVRLGVAMPADKRLRALCEAVLEEPTRHATLAGWARDAAASERTVARLFREELKTTFLQWRQQVLLAKALSMAARKLPMGTIASELGYASASAFTAMVRRSVGAPPSRFFA